MIGDGFKNTKWLGLTIVEETESMDTDEGFVEFIAQFIDGNGEHQTMHESSRFCHLEQHWYYINGIEPQPGRNTGVPVVQGRNIRSAAGH